MRRRVPWWILWRYYWFHIRFWLEVVWDIVYTLAPWIAIGWVLSELLTKLIRAGG